MKVNGVSIAMQKLMKGAENFAKASGFSLAMFLGVISPKMSTTTVITMVETAAPLWAISPTNSTVAMAVIVIFTTLFPMRIVVSSLSYFSPRSKTFCALSSPSPAMVLSLILFMDVKAVSVAEKYAENNIKITIAMICPVIFFYSTKAL